VSGDSNMESPDAEFALPRHWAESVESAKRYLERKRLITAFQAVIETFEVSSDRIAATAACEQVFGDEWRK